MTTLRFSTVQTPQFIIYMDFLQETTVDCLQQKNSFDFGYFCNASEGRTFGYNYSVFCDFESTDNLYQVDNVSNSNVLHFAVYNF